MAETEIRECEGMKNIHSETQKHRRLKRYEDSISELCNNLKHIYVYVIVVLEEGKEG